MCRYITSTTVQFNTLPKHHLLLLIHYDSAASSIVLVQNFIFGFSYGIFTIAYDINLVILKKISFFWY